MALSESQALALIERGLAAQPVRRDVQVGLGDDAAVLTSPGQKLVLTCDTCEEGAHFRAGWLSPENLAHKAFFPAASDVSAMGGRPRAAITHLTLTKEVTGPFLRRFVAAQAKIAASSGVAFVGGNLSFGRTLSVGTSVLGVVDQAPLCRSGARPGDEIWLFGEVGLARAGYLFLERGLKARASRSPEGRACLVAFREPGAMLKQGPRLLGRATACMDVSDGLSRDLSRLSKASKVRLVLEAEAVLEAIPEPLTAAARMLGEEPLSLAVTGGEDYALLATGPKRARPRGAKVIGRVEPGRGAHLEKGGALLRLKGGFEHRVR